MACSCSPVSVFLVPPKRACLSSGSNRGSNVKVVHEHNPGWGHRSTISEHRFIEFRFPVYPKT
jgi:hypothetical protein